MKQKNVRKVIAAAVLSTFSLSLLAGCGEKPQSSNGEEGTEGEKSYQIGIVQLSTHGALDAANEGMVAGLADNGFVEGENLTIVQTNAQGEQSNLQTIAQQYVSSNVDIIGAIATPAAQVMASATEEIPIVATAITSFETANLVESEAAPNTNVTGTNDMTPIKEQIDLLLQVAPETQVIGTVYTSSEVNSQVQVDMMKEYAAEKNLEIVEATISNINDIQQAVQSLISKNVDAICLPTDNNVASGMAQLSAMTNEAGIVTMCAEEAQVVSGGTLTYGINFYSIGYDAGVMAAQILKGEGKPATMPVQGPKTEDLKLVINTSSVEAVGITIPQEIMDKADIITTEAS